jgi:hypothetical protein
MRIDRGEVVAPELPRRFATVRFLREYQIDLRRPWHAWASVRECHPSTRHGIVGPEGLLDTYLILVLFTLRHARRFSGLPAAAAAIGFCIAASLPAAAATEATSGEIPAEPALPCVWRTVRSADPHPFLFDRFDSVAAPLPREALVVGDYFTGEEGGRRGAFIERWNGRRWGVVEAPIPRGSILWSLSAAGGQNAWAVGQTEEGGQLIVHWGGTRWRVVAPPRDQNGTLFSVVARAPSDVWAVGVRNRGGGGKTLIEHWDGTKWSVVPSPSPPPAVRSNRPYAILRAVTAISRTNVWAVGYSGGVRSPVIRTLIEHWDGRDWKIVPSPNVRSRGGVINNILFSISGSRPYDVWAVGSWGSVAGGYGGKGDHTLVLHWGGRRWSRSETPVLRARALLSGVAAGVNQAWAVGDRGLQPHQRALIERFDGKRWSVVRSPQGFSLNAVSARPGGGVWAVGANGRRPLAALC